MKVGAVRQADLKLFLKDELEGCVPLITSGDVKGYRHVGPEKLTTLCVNYIWCNASACPFNALKIQCPSSISMMSEDGTDWAEDGLLV